MKNNSEICKRVNCRYYVEVIPQDGNKTDSWICFAGLSFATIKKKKSFSEYCPYCLEMLIYEDK